MEKIYQIASRPYSFLLHPTWNFPSRINLEDLWIGLYYKKLSNICYNWGIIGHENKDSHGDPFFLKQPSRLPFEAASPWLKADNPRSHTCRMTPPQPVHSTG